MLMITRVVKGMAMSEAKSHRPPNSTSRLAYSSAITSTTGWSPLTAAGLNQSLVTCRYLKCASPWRWTRVAGISRPSAARMSYCASGAGADRSVFKSTSLRRDTSVTSACRRIAQKGVHPSASTRTTGESCRSSATAVCQSSMSANAEGSMKIRPRGSAVTVEIWVLVKGSSCVDAIGRFGSKARRPSVRGPRPGNDFAPRGGRTSARRRSFRPVARDAVDAARPGAWRAGDRGSPARLDHSHCLGLTADNVYYVKSRMRWAGTRRAPASPSWRAHVPTQVREADSR